MTIAYMPRKDANKLVIVQGKTLGELLRDNALGDNFDIVALYNWGTKIPEEVNRALVELVGCSKIDSDDAFLVPLQSFSQQALATFLDIELPQAAHTPPSGDHYHTIGQFYAALKDGLIYLAERDKDLFNGDPARQLGPEHYYGSGGRLVPVHCLDDAIKGINEIVGQGEGIDGGVIDAGGPMPGPDVEYAHYFRFKEIACERRYRPQDKANAAPTGAAIEVDWSADATYQMRPNPKLAHYEPGSPLWNKTLDFNRTYMALLDAIHHAFNGEPGAIARTIPMMWDLKYKALELMKIPLNDSETAGPSFEYISPNLESRS